MFKLPPIIFENQDFIVLNKPAGLLSIPDRTDSEISLKKILQQKFNEIYTIHRLDKLTSGIIIFAKNETTHKIFSTIFEERKIIKKYIGIVEGKMPENKASIELPVMPHRTIMGKMIVHNNGKMAVTTYTVIEHFNHYDFVEFDILTGKTHQIRVHLQHIGNPIVADELYGSNNPILLSSLKRKYKLSKFQEEEKPILQRQALHAKSIEFQLNNQQYFFESPIPKDITACLQILKKWDV